MDVITKLIKIYNDYSNKTQSVLAKLLLLNLHDTYPSSIYELADKCFTSPTAISRFVKTMEYTGYPQYKYFVRETINSYCNQNRVIPISDNTDDASVIREYISQLQKSLDSFENNTDQAKIDSICDKIHSSANVVCISPSIGHFPMFQYDLFLQGKTSKFPYGLSETEDLVANLEPNSFALVFIPPERESARMEKVLEDMHAKGLEMAVLASTKFRSVKKYSDLVIKYEATNSNLDNFYYDAFIDVITLSYRKKFIDEG